MITCPIRLSDVKDIQLLCNAAVEFPFNIDILSGNYILDAKSFMGIFSLDLNQPMQIRIDATDEQAAAFLQKIQKLQAK